MTEGLKRYYGRGHLHFITFSCYRRLPFLQAVGAKDLFVEELSRVVASMNSPWSVMSSCRSMFTCCSASPQRGLLRTVLQMLKQRVSRKLRYEMAQAPLPVAEIAEKFRQFWQTRFYDFNVYSDSKKREKLDYMHRNPVARELVRRPQDWPWSSYLFYEKGEAGPDSH